MNKKYIILVCCLFLTLIGCKRKIESEKSIYNVIRDDYTNTTNPVHIFDSVLYVTFDNDDSSIIETMEVYPNEDLIYLYNKDDLLLNISTEDGKASIYVLYSFGKEPSLDIKKYSCNFSEDDCSKEAKYYMSFLKNRLLQYGIGVPE